MRVKFPILIFALMVLCLHLGACNQSPTLGSIPSGPLSSAKGSGVVGGDEAERSSFGASSVVMITGESEDLASFICTGTFIAPDWILTAGHCINQNPNLLNIFFNTKPLESSEALVSLKATRVIRHPRYAKSPMERNDIALIQFSGGLPQGAHVARISPLSDSSFRAIGFGRTNGLDLDDGSDLQGAGVLRFADLDASARVKELSSSASSRAFFFMDQTSGKGVCAGDSGGPLLQGHKNVEDSQVVGVASGVLSFSENPVPQDPDACKSKSIYMNVDFYKSWIIGEMQKASELPAEKP